ncbi:MAG: polysaccharide pyruvyl transferase family protein [Candidatus Omnitrophota bacterium]|nr:polysaccharide pyruvyl transferase family protein [Candidatus Omnitrophota bacterium]
MGKRVIISGITTTLNNGCWAMAGATMAQFKAKYKNITFIYLTHPSSKDEKRLKKEGIIFLYVPWFRIQIPKIRFVYSYFCAIVVILNIIFFKYFRLNIFYRKFCKVIFSADFLVDLGGDSVSIDYEDYGVCFHMLPPLIMLLLNKPYCFYAQSIGPFKRGILYKLVIFILKKASLITAREKITYDLLFDNGIKENVRLTADAAFLLESVSFEEAMILANKTGINTKNKYFAISISNLISNYMTLDRKRAYDFYVKGMAKICDYIIERYSFNAIFISHVLTPGNDDRRISKLVVEAMEQKGKTIIIQEELNASQIKGIVKFCAFMIASRMHAAIGAVSQCIPTILYAYNHKAYGIFGDMLGMNELIIDIRTLKENEFVPISAKTIDNLLNRNKEIGERLDSVIPVIKEKSMQNLVLCEKFLS